MNHLKIQAILEKALKEVAPSDTERKKVEGIINFTKKTIESEIKNQKIEAEIMVGGSMGKDTWVKGNSDIDFFIKFDEKYKEDKIDDILGKIVKSVFPNASTVHGSRDYYKIYYKGYEMEFVPVFGYKDPSKAQNSMDASPFHVKYVKHHSRINQIGDQVRLLKTFAKAQGFYGAETYSAGLSGYVSELLIIHYGSFMNLLEAFETEKPKIIIDMEKQYKNEAEIMKNLSEAKLKSPLILIDPVLKIRNASAALNYQTYSQMIFSIRTFIRNPNLKFFKDRNLSIEKIKRQSLKRGTILITLDLKHKKELEEGIFLAKIQKRIERVNSKLEKEGIEVYDFGYLNKQGKLKIYFELETLKLSRYYKHFGPPIWVDSNHFDEFLKKHKNAYVQNNSLVIDLKRKYVNIKSFALSILKEEIKNV